jgi:hypothetical protein
LDSFTPAELFVLFQQSGMAQAAGKSRAFVRALMTGRFPAEELEKFVQGDPSLVDEFLEEPSQTLEAVEASEVPTPQDEPTETDTFIGEPVSDSEDDGALPIVHTGRVLAAVDLPVISSADEEAIEFLLASAVAKIWKHAFASEPEAVREAETYKGGTYSETVRAQFLDEHRAAVNLPIPTGYAFKIDGIAQSPNLMQRLIAVRVRDRHRVGNWSGTGAGKTLSAVLASRVVDARLTVVCCPNSVVEGWRQAILAAFPDSVVTTKSFDTTARVSTDDLGFGHATKVNDRRYLVLNYEMFQQPDSAAKVQYFLEREQIDFIVIDEIHYAKQRQVENMSRRRKLVAALVSGVGEKNPGLRVLGMSATPVINNEAYSRASL